MKTLLLLVTALALASCAPSETPSSPDTGSENGGASSNEGAGGEDPGKAEEPQDEGSDSAKAVRVLRSAIAELEKRPEHSAPEVQVQHILVAFKGAPRMRGITRSKEEAEELAGDLFLRIQAGEDFDQLVKEHTDDSHPGIYDMTTSSRSGMVAGFGNVGWRLDVNEVGVAPHDSSASPFGWHIIKRLK